MDPAVFLLRTLVLFVLTAMTAVSPHPAAASATVEEPRVLILHSYAQDFSWTRDLHAGILSVLDTPAVRARYRVEYLDAKHHDSPAYQLRLFELFREKYRATRFDGILVTDNHALELVARHRAELFPRIPVVACGINDRASVPAGVDDLYSIIENLAHMATLNAALHQNPGTRKIFVLVDDTLSGQSIRQDFLEQVRPLTDRVAIEILPVLTRDQLVRFVRGRTAGELLYLLVYFQDATGQVFTAEEIPRAVAANASVPVYVAWDFQLDSAAMGGCVTSGFGHGQKSAQTLLDRLAGKTPPAIYDGLQGVTRQVYNYPALERFGIVRSSLPADAVLLHRPQSYYELHRSAILSGLVVVAILTVIIVLLSLNVIKQHRINSGNREILKLNREVIETQLELLSTLGEVIESRSQDTANHVRRVAAYSALLGRKYGLAEEDILLLEAASPMHDVGKIGIPDAILHKPGQLTPEEYEIIKRHTVVGERILHKSSRKLMATARTIALQHHERWDGSGYPCGLKGEAISLLARISALADVYDALSMGRPYKPAWPREKVLAYIRHQRGRMFDPQIVDLFFASLDELEVIRERLSDPVRPPDEVGTVAACVLTRSNDSSLTGPE